VTEWPPDQPACMLLMLRLLLMLLKHGMTSVPGSSPRVAVRMSLVSCVCESGSFALLQAGLKRTVGNFVLSDLRRFEVGTPQAAGWLGMQWCFAAARWPTEP
jgi:hypothetical protein